ncbi:hypothetical protein H311_00120, partial [Anncaliia algerae PRA109]
ISERINGTINTTLRIYKNNKSLDEVVQLCERSLNVNYNRGLMSTPNIIHKNLNLLGIKENKIINLKALYEQMIKFKEKDLTKKNKKRTTGRNYKIGDKVYCKRNLVKKIDKIWEGPYEINELRSNGNLVLVNKGNRKQWYSIRNIRLVRGVECRNTTEPEEHTKKETINFSRKN